MKNKYFTFIVLIVSLILISKQACPDYKNKVSQLPKYVS